MNLPGNPPVARSPGPRLLFFVSVIVTVVLLLWSHSMGLHGAATRMTPIFFLLFSYFDYHAAMGALIVLALAAFVPSTRGVRPLLQWIGNNPVPVACAMTVLMGIGALLAYQQHPLAMDEYTQVFQSQVFAAGHLTGRLPPALLDWLIPHGFQNYFLNVSGVSGRVASAYWPSFALLLTPFTWLGIAWACNPVISGLTLIVVHRLAVRLFDSIEAAGVAVLLTVASPVFFANGISYYSMPAHLLANCLYALLLLNPTRRSAIGAGIVGSVALTLHNPVPHLLFAIPWFIWVATRPGGVRLLLWLCVGYVPLCLVLGVGWYWFSVHLVHDGMAAAAPGSNAAELARLGSAFAFPDGSVMVARLMGLAKVWLWAVPGLVILACAGLWKWRNDTRCWLFAGSAILTFAGYMFVTVDQGHGWGFRYFHSAWIALPLLGAAALTRKNETGPADDSLNTSDLRAFVTACAVLSLVIGVGQRTAQIHEFISDDLAEVPAYTGSERRVVFIDASTGYYGVDLVQNDPWLRGNVIRMLGQSTAADAAVVHQHFPEFHLVYEDIHGTVWSQAQPTLAATPHRARK